MLLLIWITLHLARSSFDLTLIDVEAFKTRRNVLLINKRVDYRCLRTDSPLDLFRSILAFGRIHEYAHRHSRAPVTKGAVTRDVICTYRCPHDNPNASELSIPKKPRTNLCWNPRVSIDRSFFSVISSNKGQASDIDYLLPEIHTISRKHRHWCSISKLN